MYYCSITWYLEISMKDRFVDSFVMFKYTIVYLYEHDVIKWVLLFFSHSFLTIIESMLGRFRIITLQQRKFWLLFFFFKAKKWIVTHVSKLHTFCNWPTIIVCIHICQTYLTELPYFPYVEFRITQNFANQDSTVYAVCAKNH